MHYVLIQTGEDAQEYPMPLNSIGCPAFLPRRGDQINYEGREFVVEGVKWYLKDGSWACAVFAHRILTN